MQPFFITSTGTNIGKTLVTTALVWQLRQAGKMVTALKPVISGYDPNDAQSDSALILQSYGLTPAHDLAASISPWRYTIPLAPNMAAAKEGKPVEFEKLVAFCREHMALASDIVLVEGVGGVMVPLDNAHTVLDWMVALGWPVILVGGYLSRRDQPYADGTRGTQSAQVENAGAHPQRVGRRCFA